MMGGTPGDGDGPAAHLAFITSSARPASGKPIAPRSVRVPVKVGAFAKVCAHAAPICPDMAMGGTFPPDNLAGARGLAHERAAVHGGGGRGDDAGGPRE